MACSPTLGVSYTGLALGVLASAMAQRRAGGRPSCTMRHSSEQHHHLNSLRLPWVLSVRKAPAMDAAVHQAAVHQAAHAEQAAERRQRARPCSAARRTHRGASPLGTAPRPQPASLLPPHLPAPSRFSLIELFSCFDHFSACIGSIPITACDHNYSAKLFTKTPSIRMPKPCSYK